MDNPRLRVATAGSAGNQAGPPLFPSTAPLLRSALCTNPRCTHWAVHAGHRPLVSAPSPAVSTLGSGPDRRTVGIFRFSLN